MQEVLFLESPTAKADQEFKRGLTELFKSLAYLSTFLPSEMRLNATERLALMSSLLEHIIFRSRLTRSGVIILIFLTCALLNPVNWETIIHTIPTPVLLPTTTPTVIPSPTPTLELIPALVATHEAVGRNVEMVYHFTAPGTQQTIHTPDGDIIVRFEGYVTKPTMNAEATLTTSPTDVVRITMRGPYDYEFDLMRNEVGANKYFPEYVYLVAVWTPETPYPLILEGN